MSKEINGYNLSRNWFNFSFENPDMVKPIHTAVYMWCIEKCNRLGWKDKFGFPTGEAMEAIGVSSKNTYLKALNDLIKWNFITLIKESKNQHQARVVAISKIDTAHGTALDTALIRHEYGTIYGTDTIDKQINHKQINHKQCTPPDVDDVLDYFQEKGFSKDLAEKFFNYYHEPMQDRNGRVWKDQNGKTVKSWKQKAISVWMKDEHKNGKYEKGSIEHGKSVSERVDRIFGD